ncbi:MAG TPA: GGDEF domain-containing protein [Halothiobacillus sp.]|jgi:diguanylate cyclase (GGDEF)-like protein|nr:GGDEF domain-containing protein [Halothiobacillus sp.]HQS28946.1 GGDEF domain-containing protein [Halothiobacillus sp.]
MQISKHVFRALALGMVSMGLVVGAAFPLFVMGFGVPKATALAPTFIAATLISGFVVGWLNFALASGIVRPRLKKLATGMQHVRGAMQQATFSGDWSSCDPAMCRLDERDEDELGAVAHSYNALLYALHEAHRIEAQIRDFTKTLSSKLDLHELGDQALSMLQANARAQGGAIVLERQGDWTVLASRGLNHPEKILESQAFIANQDQTIQNRITLPPGMMVDAVLTQFVPADVLLTPIKNHGLVLGWVILASAQAFAEDVPRVLPLMMQGLGLALNNALLHDDLQRVAALDPLTGIYNRRFGFKRFEEELNRAERNRSSLAILLLDLDHFKRINDTYGHLSGDKVLIQSANICREILREGDVLLRYGGEEFVIVLPGASLHDAKEVAERIRFAISQSIVRVGDQALNVTSSIGIAATSGQGLITTAEDLVAQADQRLYMAKATGRNKVVAEGLPDPHASLAAH